MEQLSIEGLFVGATAAHSHPESFQRIHVVGLFEASCPLHGSKGYKGVFDCAIRLGEVQNAILPRLPINLPLYLLNGFFVLVVSLSAGGSELHHAQFLPLSRQLFNLDEYSVRGEVSLRKVNTDDVLRHVF